MRPERNHEQSNFIEFVSGRVHCFHHETRLSLSGQNRSSVETETWWDQVMNKFIKFAIVASGLCTPVQAFAVTGNVIFNADVNNTCVINIVDAGIMKGNVGLTQLSSETAGGQPGLATVATTSSAYSVNVNSPLAFSTFPTGGAATSFAAKYSTTGASVYSNQTVANPLAVGTTNVQVHLAATKATGSFPTGTYTATVVLRCE